MINPVKCLKAMEISNWSQMEATPMSNFGELTSQGNSLWLQQI